MKAVASLRYGVIFKKAFSRPEIFKAFVKDILGIELQIDQVETEKSFERPIGSVDSRFDLFAEDEDMLQIEFDPKNRHGKGVGEIPHKILYLCPKYVNDETPEAWREWLLAINDSLDGEVNEADYQNACVQRVLQLIEKDHITPAEYARMKDEYSEEQLRIKEWEEAIEKSKAEGMQLGVEKGKSEEKYEVARRMLAKGLDVSLVAELTGLELSLCRHWCNEKVPSDYLQSESILSLMRF
ncbi:MAG: hypothetical protein WAQ53_14255 [Thiofilum sp.]|uniref:hypothetical protein n=1 Tax=Thiofilum sp. TaxID=2212733 RepID=UPI0025E687C5|nr:hypothetical protein [Thiofilum sp.]